MVVGTENKNCAGEGQQQITALFRTINSSILIQQIKIPLPMSQATVSNHRNVIFELSLSGLASEAWEPSNNMLLFLPRHSKVSLTFSMTLYLCAISIPINSTINPNPVSSDYRVIMCNIQ
jgi:hypothetical protein